MRSLLIEFHRFNNLETGSLRTDDPYLIAAGGHPVRQFQMPVDHDRFLDLMLGLRYQSGPTPREEALAEIARIVTSIVGADTVRGLESGEFPLQLDLVVNAAELAAIPFEALVDDTGQPLLIRGESAVELTRRVRHDFAEGAVTWPSQPRVLFAWASPPGVSEVPHAEHADALRKALEPWLPVLDANRDSSDAAGVLTTLPEASRAKLEDVCAAALSKKSPFTHVHLLAHGYPVGRAHRQRFGLALHGGNGELDAVPPEAVTEALAALSGSTVVVTLATCDAANMTNTLLPEKSVAHELHVAGFPVVVASQLPLTVAGSNLMVECFYGALLAGRDVRIALHEARVALYENRSRTGHDWVSLVAYVQLPESYAEHLKEVRLQAVLASLRTTQAYSDEVITSPACPAKVFERVARLLAGRIDDLEKFLKDPNEPKRPGVLEENRGLLGSAEKRLAELHFERDRRGDAGDWRQQAGDALRRSRDWYRQGFQRNLSHHWTGVQFLSLEAALEGQIEDAELWHAAVAAARIAARNPEEYWAQGSLMELHLLAPLAGQGSQEDAAVAALTEMKLRVTKAGSDRFPLESTERQLRRYATWWTAANGFFPGRADLAQEAGRLVTILES